MPATKLDSRTALIVMPELNAQARDHLVSKLTWGAFASTDPERLPQVLRCRPGCGLRRRNKGVESTARQAHELGFNVTLGVDAMTDISAEAHARSPEGIFPRLGETGTTQKTVDLLSTRNA